jgi:hypothetical protein
MDNPSNRPWNVVCDDFSAANQSDNNSVTIMFSPTGEVDRVYYSDPINMGNITSEIPTGPIFLNIGIWERTGFWMEDATKTAGDPLRWYISNDYLPDANSDPYGNISGTRNYHDMNNYWVTLFPRTGTIRVNRLSNNNSSRASSGAIGESRRHAGSLHGSEAK